MNLKKRILEAFQLSETPELNDYSSLGDFGDNDRVVSLYKKCLTSNTVLNRFSHDGVDFSLFSTSVKIPGSIEQAFRAFAIHDNKVIGFVEARKNGDYMFPKVVTSKVRNEHQGKGIGTTLYTVIIDACGGLVSSSQLSGTNDAKGSIDMWIKLSKKYNSYIINDFVKPKVIIPVPSFSKQHSVDPHELFMVSVKKLDIPQTQEDELDESYSVDKVIASMKKADSKGHRGVRSDDHYDYWRTYPEWSLVSLPPESIDALATDEDLVGKIPNNNHEPALITARTPNNIFAQDGNHRILAAKARGDKTIKCWIPTSQLGNVRGLIVDELDESPAWDDTNKEMSSEEEPNSNITKYKMVKKIEILFYQEKIGDYTIEGYKSSIDGIVYYNMFSLMKGKIAGMLDANKDTDIETFVKVESSVVFDKHQRNGLALAMYRAIIDNAGALQSDASLTGEDKLGGSFDVWRKLGTIYPFKYLYRPSKKSLIPVKSFERSMMKTSLDYFVVSKKDISSNLNESPDWDDSPKNMAYREPKDTSTNTSEVDRNNYDHYIEGATKFGEQTIGKYRIEGWKDGPYNGHDVFAFDGDYIVGKFLSSVENILGMKIPQANLVVVYKNYQHNGIALAMYRMVINETGRMISSPHLTGKEGHGSYDIWRKLSSIYPYCYIYDKQLNTLKQAHIFTKKDMRDKYTQFIVSKNKMLLSSNKLMESDENEDTGNHWYHGSPSHISSFSDEFVGNGTDQEGPGIYFTTNLEDAYGYSRKGIDERGEVVEVSLNFRKTVPLKGKAKRSEIIQLMKWAPNLEDTLTNWDENPKVAFTNALAAMLNQENPHQSFMSVWYDFYRNNPKEYIRNMVLLGYDGVIIQREFMNTKHAVVYNPKIVKIIDRRE